MSARPPPEPAEISELGAGLRCNTKFAALVIVLFPLAMALGGWQLWRAGEKEALLEQAASLTTAEPRRIGMLAREVPDRTPLVLVGRYTTGRDFLLDNRILRGQVGYELITPFVDQDGTVVFVNRGWLLAPRTRDQLPDFATPEQRLRLIGDVHAPEDRRGLRMHPAEGWPRVIQAIDVEAMAELAGVEAYPYVVRLRAGQPGVSEADWPAVNMGPERHRAYALQWFLMGFALLAVFAFGGTNLREWIKHRRDGKHTG